jgi:hypothetical protein
MLANRCKAETHALSNLSWFVVHGDTLRSELPDAVVEFGQSDITLQMEGRSASSGGICAQRPESRVNIGFARVSEGARLVALSI